MDVFDSLPTVFYCMAKVRGLMQVGTIYNLLTHTYDAILTCLFIMKTKAKAIGIVTSYYCFEIIKSERKHCSCR